MASRADECVSYLFGAIAFFAPANPVCRDEKSDPPSIGRIDVEKIPIAYALQLAHDWASFFQPVLVSTEFFVRWTWFS